MKRTSAFLMAFLMLCSLSVSACARTRPKSSGDGAGILGGVAVTRPAVTAKIRSVAEEKTGKKYELPDKTAPKDNVKTNIRSEKKTYGRSVEVEIGRSAEFSNSNGLYEVFWDSKTKISDFETSLKTDESAGQPFCAVAGGYPAKVTLRVEDPDNFAGLLAFVDGEWKKINTVINDDGTFTFVLEGPSVLSIVSEIVKAP